MRASVVRPRGGVRLFLFLLLLAGPAASGVAIAQDEPLQALSSSGDGQLLTLVPTSAGARVELPGGQTVTAALPARATVSSFAALDGGWVAAGSAPDANGGRHLFLLRGDDRAAHSLPAPLGQTGRSRSGPMLLVDGGRLAGLAWLEGDGERAFAVRSALWTGSAWKAPERVSFPGPGSQLGLTGAVLADGSWLLAWSAFDGHDDEIVWSRRLGNGSDAWQPVKRLHPDNAVPDITPSLAATADGGALIAWSRYDGHGYALRMARFARGAWGDEHAAAPTGSLYPTFLGAAKLLYLDVLDVLGAGAPGARGWSVLDLDPSGRAKARASVASALDRPAVRFSGGAAEMCWPAGPAGTVRATATFTPVDRVP